MPKDSPDIADPACLQEDSSAPTPAEGLALVKAFLKINDSALRQAILQLVQRIADRVDKP